MYHGWKFDAEGNCLEQPYEDTTHPEDNYKAKCSIDAYPVQELAGLVWAYMGPQPAPLLPRWVTDGLRELRARHRHRRVAL